jgi:FHA domain-containing protein
VPPFVLTVIKVVFLALLYFFVYRAIRSVVVDVRAAQPANGSETAGAGAGRGPRRGARRKIPRSVVVLAADGSKLATHGLNEQMRIGRAEACQIQVADTYVSQFHARLFPRDGSWFAEDLGSTNGTYLNERRITSPAEVQAGDRLRLGKVTMELKG